MDHHLRLFILECLILEMILYLGDNQIGQISCHMEEILLILLEDTKDLPPEDHHEDLVNHLEDHHHHHLEEDDHHHHLEEEDHHHLLEDPLPWGAHLPMEIMETNNLFNKLRGHHLYPSINPHTVLLVNKCPISITSIRNQINNYHFWPLHIFQTCQE